MEKLTINIYDDITFLENCNKSKIFTSGFNYNERNCYYKFDGITIRNDKHVILIPLNKMSSPINLSDNLFFSSFVEHNRDVIKKIQDEINVLLSTNKHTVVAKTDESIRKFNINGNQDSKIKINGLLIFKDRGYNFLVMYLDKPLENNINKLEITYNFNNIELTKETKEGGRESIKLRYSGEKSNFIIKKTKKQKEVTKLEFDKQDIGVYLPLVEINIKKGKYIQLLHGKSGNLYDVAINPPKLVGKFIGNDKFTKEELSKERDYFDNLFTGFKALKLNCKKRKVISLFLNKRLSVKKQSFFNILKKELEEKKENTGNTQEIGIKNLADFKLKINELKREIDDLEKTSFRDKYPQYFGPTGNLYINKDYTE